MADVNISGGIRHQAPIQDVHVEDAQPTEVSKDQTPISDSSKQASPQQGPSSQKSEKDISGFVLKNQLNKQLNAKSLDSESLKAADKVLENPKLSNEAKIAELQKILGKTDKLEFEYFLNHYSNFPADQKQLINSAITESEHIMGRVATELKQEDQLKLVEEAMKNPLKGKTPKEEEKRLQRFDKGMYEWIKKTDMDTLDKALGGRSIDIKASVKLYGVLASEPAIFIKMFNDGKLLGDKMEIATAVMNARLDPQGPASRYDQEMLAGSLLLRNIQEEERQKSIRRNPERQ